ncbi:hypothetical protein [Vibrio sp. SCSIO 43137]|uniref:hypothetical protein n=1 Tax=Vibrio sp. SCSIO 43137 TaxID=3021011 RepID=UPI0023072327|nr:hypothetical protein [Vibrio sp. SCSIO 43137]WCE32424.1 hypothetical protein PK654_18195 [Vibrio sp. SCSIO 43137]
MIRILIIAIFSSVIFGCSSPDKEKAVPKVTFDHNQLKGDWQCTLQEPDKEITYKSHVTNGPEDTYIETGVFTGQMTDIKSPFVYKIIMSGEKRSSSNKIYTTINYYYVEAANELSEQFFKLFLKSFEKQLKRDRYRQVDTLHSLSSQQYKYVNDDNEETVCSKAVKSDSFEATLKLMMPAYIDDFNKKVTVIPNKQADKRQLSGDMEGMIVKETTKSHTLLNKETILTEVEKTQWHNKLITKLCFKPIGKPFWVHGVPLTYEVYNTNNSLITSSTFLYSECDAIK